MFCATKETNSPTSRSTLCIGARVRFLDSLVFNIHWAVKHCMSEEVGEIIAEVGSVASRGVQWLWAGSLTIVLAAGIRSFNVLISGSGRFES